METMTEEEIVIIQNDLRLQTPKQAVIISELSMVIISKSIIISALNRCQMLMDLQKRTDHHIIHIHRKVALNKAKRLFSFPITFKLQI
jgi:hypothetical protein